MSEFKDMNSVDAFEALMDKEPDNFHVPENERVAPKEKVEPEDLSEDDEDQVETDSPEATDDESEDSNTKDDEAEEEYVTVKVNGKSYEIPKSLEAGIMKDEDYSRKTEALSHEKKLLDKQLNEVADLAAQRNAVIQERTAYKEQLVELAKVIGQAKNETEYWNNLRLENPGEYAVQQMELQKHEQDLVAKFRAAQAAEHQDYQKRLYQEQQASLAKLAEWDPAWKDPVVLGTHMRKVCDYAIRKGIATEADFNNVNDPRVLWAFSKAYEHDQLTSKVSQVKVQAQKSKSLPAGSAGRSNSNNNSSFKKDLERLQKSGGYDSQAAGDLFARFI